MKILGTLVFFFPVLLFLIFLVLNFSLVGVTREINLFFLYRGEVPIVLVLSVFFIFYTLGLWATFKFSNFFSNMKAGKLGGEIHELKAELYDKQGSLIENIKKEFRENLEGYKSEAEKDRKVYKTETDKVLNNLQFEVTKLTEKVSELPKK